ncbi:MAG: hypothetical protein BYD32DRAFT_427683, partial [Podila humilis]
MNARRLYSTVCLSICMSIESSSAVFFKKKIFFHNEGWCASNSQEPKPSLWSLAKLLPTIHGQANQSES